MTFGTGSRCPLNGLLALTKACPLLVSLSLEEDPNGMGRLQTLEREGLLLTDDHIESIGDPSECESEVGLDDLIAIKEALRTRKISV